MAIAGFVNTFGVDHASVAEWADGVKASVRAGLAGPERWRAHDVVEATRAMIAHPGALKGFEAEIEQAWEALCAICRGEEPTDSPTGSPEAETEFLPAGATMYGIIGWIYDADMHCDGHAIARFGRESLIEETAIDSAGNPAHPLFAWDEAGDNGDYCAECIYQCIREGLDPKVYADLRA